MPIYTRLHSTPIVSQTDLDAFTQSDADPLAKIFATALYGKPEPAKPGQVGFGRVGTFGPGIEIISNRQARREAHR